tara:strand:+ start:2663 stop:3265 length:603 start_codon:yes stop_codon:yes gene_type:complete
MGAVREYFEAAGLTPADIVPAFVCVRARATTRETRIKTRRARDRFSTDSRLTTTDDALARARRFHEVISVAFAASTWIGCYAVRPSTTMLRPLRETGVGKKLAPTFRRALEAAATQTARATTRVPALRAANPERLTLSLAESLMFRGAIKPITFGGKLWLSYRFVVWTKTLGDGARAGTAKTRGRTRGRRSGKSTDVVVR